MKLQEYIVKDEKKMSYGYTTGSCATGAAGAAVEMLLTGERVDHIKLMTPKGFLLLLEIEDIDMHLPEYVSCAVRKDAGDDPDVTNGVLVYARVERKSRIGQEESPEICIQGGIGVGRVTKPGLDQPVGAAAINSGPREQIKNKVLELCKLYNCKEDLLVTVSIPEGIHLAEKTFNPRIGIEGGISVLGTSGIVEPMSDQALIETIRVELKMHRAQGEKAVAIAPGNYGLQFMQKQYHYPLDHAVKCSNFVKDSMEIAAELGFEKVLFTGHLGKLVKVAAGTENTHSGYGDGRMDMLSRLAKQFGGDESLSAQIMECVATDEVVRLLEKQGLKEAVMRETARLVQYHAGRFSGNKVQIEVILFSNEFGLLAETEQAESLIKELSDATK
ncbi:MAG: cobalt-precorrin-5B (C(1))-methyltransferase CbiD [Lachnospiraceae bacterium]